MGIRVFDLWSARVVHSMPLTALKNSVIGIDAAYYLEHLLSPPKETVLSAIGGWPLALESVIAKELDDIQSAGLKVHFVFNGLDYGIKDNPFGPSIASSIAIAKAFDLYEKNLAPEAIDIFKAANVPTPTALSEFLKKVLHNHGIEFTVAPYSALAQLVYYEKDPSQFIDAIYGPSELFIYGVDKLITKFGLTYDHVENIENGISRRASSFSLDHSTFSWINRRECLEQLGPIPPEVFIDACVLAGSNLIDTFPPLKDPEQYGQGFTMLDAIGILMTCGRSITALCTQYQNEKGVKRMDYLDRYKRVVTSVRHHIVVTKSGNIEPLEALRVPDDIHDCIGQRLPEELNLYLFRGMIRPRVLNWLTSGTILITAPYDGGDSLDYQNLVKEQLQPWRKQAVGLLAYSCHRYYQKKEITTKFWFGEQHEQKFNIGDLPSSDLSSNLRAWHVKDQLIMEQQQAMRIKPGGPSSSLYYCVRSIADDSFASKTNGVKPKGGEPLTTIQEIVANVIWRFLQIREYVNKKHQLTPWGIFLEATVGSLGSSPSREQVEAAFVGVELLRLGLLNPLTMFPNYSGAPLRKTETDRRNCMLVARVACLGKLRHKPRGYSGPLSRHLLAYRSIISEVRASLRDLVEMSLVSLFLGAEADVVRDRSDWMDISLALPFHEDTSCALGIIVKTYLDELHLLDDPTSVASRAEMKEKGQGWLEHADFQASFDDAMQLWDAVYQSVSIFDESFAEKRLWDEVNQWLSQRK